MQALFSGEVGGAYCAAESQADASGNVAVLFIKAIQNVSGTKNFGYSSIPLKKHNSKMASAFGFLNIAFQIFADYCKHLLGKYELTQRFL